jgi:O-antigen/teichoic acid export membrane protein
VSGPTPTPAPDAAAVAEDPFAVGTASRRVVRGGGLRVVGTVVGLLTGLLSAPLVVRHLGNQAFGRYQTVISVVFIANALSEGGLSYVAVRAYTTADEQRRKILLANLMGMRLALELVVAALTVTFGLLAGYNRVLVIGLAFGGAGLVLAAQQGTLTTVLQGQLRLSTLALTEMANQLIVTALLVTLVASGAGLFWFFAVQPVVWLLALVLIAVIVRRDVPRRPAFNLIEWRSLASETALFAVASALGAVYYQVTQVAMSLLAPGAQTGYYAVAFRIVAVTSTIPWVLGGSMLAVLTAVTADPERLRYIARRAFEGAAILGGWLVLVIVLGASIGIAFVSGAHASVAVLRIMGAGAGATFVVGSSSFVLLSQRRNSFLFASNLGVFVLAIVLSVSLIPAYGARGGAICTAALEFALVGAYTTALWSIGIRPPARFLWRFVIALALGFAAGLPLVGNQPALAVAAGSVVYFAALTLLRAIPPELLEAIPRRSATWA